MFLENIKKCACGVEHDRIPENHKFLKDPVLGGYYWNCSCKSTLFATPNMIVEKCDCLDCLDSDNPCSQDCDSDDLCAGCLDNKTESDEMEFDQDFVMGRLGGKNIGEIK